MSPRDVRGDGGDGDGAHDARRRRRRVDDDDGVVEDDDDDDDDWIRARVASAFQSSLPTTTHGTHATDERPGVSDIALGIERAIAMARGMTMDAMKSAFAGVVEDALASDVARETFERVERRQVRDAREIARLTECVREQTREIDGLRERLGREIIHKRRSDGGFEDAEEDASAAFEKTRAECELWREACGKFRKRAEHYERLYKEAVVGASHAHSMMGVSETRVLASSLDREKRAPAAPSAVLGDFKRAMRGEPGAVKHRVVLHSNTREHGGEHGRENAVMTTVANEDAGGLWGGTQPTAERRRRDATPPPPPPVVGDSENPMHDLRADIELGRREHAAPLNRIFLDANASGDETRNGVRKNKRLSDNTPTPANEIFERPPAADVGGAAAKIESAPGASNKQVKYVEVVRKKSEREQLDAYVCEECRTFYNAMMPEKQPATIKCTHEPPSNANNSRHRAKWAPEPAPKGFWNLAFTPPETAE